MSPGIETQIQRMHGEPYNYTASQIADSLQLPEDAVVLVLSKKKSNLDKDGELRSRFEKMQDLVANTMEELATNAESEGVRLDATKYIGDVILGQKEKKNAIAPQTISLSDIMAQLKIASARYQEGIKEVVIIDQ